MSADVAVHGREQWTISAAGPAFVHAIIRTTWTKASWDRSCIDDRLRCTNGGEAVQRSSFNGCAIWFAQLSSTGSRRLRRSLTLTRAEAALTLTAATM